MMKCSCIEILGRPCKDCLWKPENVKYQYEVLRPKVTKPQSNSVPVPKDAADSVFAAQ